MRFLRKDTTSTNMTLCSLGGASCSVQAASPVSVSSGDLSSNALLILFQLPKAFFWSTAYAPEAQGHSSSKTCQLKHRVGAQWQEACAQVSAKALGDLQLKWAGSAASLKHPPPSRSGFSDPELGGENRLILEKSRAYTWPRQVKMLT